MTPTFFLGVTPPPDVAARVLAWQTELEHVTTAPHVTLLPPTERPEARWQQVARQIAARHAPVPVKLGHPDFFGSRVIFLRVDAPGLETIHADLVHTLGEAPGEFALENFHPHLTLALSWRSLNVGWAEAVRSAKATFHDLEAEPLSFTASELVLFGKDETGQPYNERGRFGLSRTS
ncbi:2'-5' RNA ligase family protein [Deinococcus rubellus]|uniref:2'-5' RNA ligase family protein n=1 Tax=Deinococcus rubellus TaxID=1889240 RepID=A0ABY5YK72_9DEIO|nr:2'-5' RNA ligase family protein [Deinococcus rubellus]UWX64659.1 2'-5' RNA ligase family protein [Deinococcus rubellus]